MLKQYISIIDQAQGEDDGILAKLWTETKVTSIKTLEEKEANI